MHECVLDACIRLATVQLRNHPARVRKQELHCILARLLLLTMLLATYRSVAFCIIEELSFRKVSLLRESIKQRDTLAVGRRDALAGRRTESTSTAMSATVFSGVMGMRAGDAIQGTCTS